MKDFVRQLTVNEAVDFWYNGTWENMTPAERGVFQLYQERLCMPFSTFHEGLEAALGRSVWTYEMGNRDSLIREYEGIENAPTLEEIINKIPAEKRIVITGA